MTEAKEVLKHEPPVLVALLGNRLGHEIKKPGASFLLSSVYDPEPMLGNDFFSRVYFRTESGNIYRLDDKGNLTDAKESQRRGAVAQTSLELEELKGQKLTIGEPFSYGSPGKRGNTSKVAEIVPVVEHRTYIPDALRQITNGRTNTIKEDFQRMLPPQKVGERNNRDLEGLVGPEDLEELKRIRAGIPPNAKRMPQATPPPAVNLNLGKEMVQAKEGDEAPKVNAVPTKPEARNVQDKDLEQKAEELAKATRGQGIGQLFGKFPPRLSPGWTGGFGSTGFFIQGEEVPDSDRSTLMLSMTSSKSMSPVYFSANSGLQPNIVGPLWISSAYEPRKEYVYVREPITRERRKSFFRVEKYQDTKRVKKFTGNLFNYHGKHGESDWIRYEYAMGLFNYPYDSRPAFVMMTVVVPPDLAAQIDEQVEKNVYFPDAFFKAIYPGYVGQDTHKDIRRKPAKELEIVNDRTGVKNVVEYPQPIPY